jgi:cytochrome c-type biogenesis protein
MAEVFYIIILIALGGGLLSFLAPCNIVTFPTFISYIGSQAKTLRRSILMSLMFAIGFCSMFALAITLFLFIYRFIQWGFWFEWFSATLILLLAIYLFFSKEFSRAAPVYNLSSDSNSDNSQFSKRESDTGEKIDANPEGSLTKYEGYTGAFTLGFSLGFGAIGCLAPIFITIIIIAAPQAGLFFLYLFLYALGIMIPFIIIGTFIGKIEARFLVKLIKISGKLQKVVAIIILYIGIELMLGVYGEPGLIPYF